MARRLYKFHWNGGQETIAAFGIWGAGPAEKILNAGMEKISDLYLSHSCVGPWQDPVVCHAKGESGVAGKNEKYAKQRRKQRDKKQIQRRKWRTFMQRKWTLAKHTILVTHFLKSGV